jgi:hypothetical protein
MARRRDVTHDVEVNGRRAAARRVLLAVRAEDLLVRRVVLQLVAQVGGAGGRLATLAVESLCVDVVSRLYARRDR